MVVVLDGNFELVDEEVRLESVVLGEVGREDVELELEEVDVGEVLVDEAEVGDMVVVTVVGSADTTDRIKDKPTPKRLSSSL